MSIQTFDVFDTLIARRGGSARNMLLEIEALGFPDFVENRASAGRTLFEQATQYNLSSIYAHMVNTGAYTQEQASKLYDLELEAERKHCIPITRNIQQVNDGDVLVSDMYHTEEFVRSLLSQAGLKKNYELVISPGGKHNGTIWPDVLKHGAISRHLGDNKHSDMISPANFGIRSRLTTEHQLTKIEESLKEKGLVALSSAMREVRLSENYTDEIHTYLHRTSVQTNFPLLVLLSYFVASQAENLGFTKIGFATRDCYQLKRVFVAMFHQFEVTDFYSSRRCLRAASADYRAYLLENVPNRLIVELDSSGTSMSEALQKLARHDDVALVPEVYAAIFLKHKRKRYRQISPHPNPPQPKIHHFLTTDKVNPETTMLWEILNFAPYPSVVDVLRLSEAGKFHPIFENRSLVEEYLDPELVHCLNKTINQCIKVTDWPAVNAELEKARLEPILTALLASLKNYSRLADIFPRILIDATIEEQAFFSGLSPDRYRSLRTFKKVLRKTAKQGLQALAKKAPITKSLRNKFHR